MLSLYLKNSVKDNSCYEYTQTTDFSHRKYLAVEAPAVPTVSFLLRSDLCLMNVNCFTDQVGGLCSGLSLQ